MQPPIIPDYVFDLPMDNPKWETIRSSMLLYLKNDPDIRNLPAVRRQWNSGIKNSAFIDNYKVEKYFWYLFHVGATKEMQFNVMAAADPNIEEYFFQVGWGFEFDLVSGEERSEKPFARFLSLCNYDATFNADFQHIVSKLNLKWRWTPDFDEPIRDVDSPDPLRWVIKQQWRDSIKFLTITRYLDRYRDASILQNPSAFSQVINSVYTGVLPFWEDVQLARYGINRKHYTQPWGSPIYP